MVSLLDFGAVGDGVTDDTRAFISALAAAGAVGFTIDGHNRTYRVTDHLGDIPSHTKLRGMNIDCTEVIGGTSSERESLFTATGSVGAAYDLASDSTTADQSSPYVSVASSGIAANFAAGDIVRLQSDESWATSLNVGEIAVVRAVVDEKIYLQSTLIYNYTTADNATIQKITPPKNIVFEDVWATGPTSMTLADASEKLGFFAAEYGQDIEVKGGGLRGFNRSGYEVRWGYNCRLRDVHFSDFIEFYGISIYNGCRNFWVENCSFDNCRHAVTVSSSNTYGGGIANYVHVIGCISSGRDASFDAHPGADNIFFTDNIMMGGGEASAAIGLMFNGRNLTAHGNRFYGYGGGISYQPLYNGNYRASVDISDNAIHVKNPSSNSYVGIYVQIGTTYNVVRADAVKVNDNVIMGNLSIGLYALLTGGTDKMQNLSFSGNVVEGAVTAIQVRSNTTVGFRNVVINGNAIRNASTAIRLRADSSSATIEGVSISGNAMADCTTGIGRTGSATFKNIAIGNDNTYVNVTTPIASSFMTATIASGVLSLICPNGIAIADTEGGAASDDLQDISAGSCIGDTIWIQSANSARDITVKHNSGGGKIRLVGGTDFTLSTTSDCIGLRWNGSLWCEVSRATVA